MKYSLKISSAAEAFVPTMSIDDVIRQICCSHYGPGEGENYIPSGSVFFHPGSVEQHKEWIDKYKKICSIPPLITTDLENGPGKMISGATAFPYLAGASGAEESVVYEMGKIAALEGGAVGYNWTLAPCVDILNNPDSPAVSIRSAGRSADAVIPVVRAYLKGTQDNGMMATAKHFPGDGYGVYDHHLTTPELPLNKQEWDEGPGKVYRAVIDAGVCWIMPGHISFPAYDEPDSVNGICPPATLSSRLMNGLLREELGFEGLIVSDAVGMGGFCGFVNYSDAYARFWEAGGDVLLFANPDEKFLKEIYERIDRGLVSEKTLRNRAVRVLSLKEELGIWKPDGTANTDSPITFNETEHRATADKIAEKAIQVVRDRFSYLPVKDALGKNALHVVLIPHTMSGVKGETDVQPIHKFSNMLPSYFKSVKTIEDPGAMKISREIESGQFDVVICSLGNGYQHGTNVIRMHGLTARNLMKGWTHLGVPVIFVAHFHHLTHLEYVAVMDCVINTHGTVEPTLIPLMEKITGKGTP